MLGSYCQWPRTTQCTNSKAEITYIPRELDVIMKTRRFIEDNRSIFDALSK